MQKIKLTLFIVLLCAFLVNIALAQDKVKPKNLKEKERKAMHSRDSVLRSLNKSDTSVNSLLQRLQQYNTTFKQINNGLDAGIDTLDIGQQVPSVARRIDKIKGLANTHKSSTLRYLFVLRDNLDHLQGKLEGWQSDLSDISSKLVQNQGELIRFSKDTVLTKASPSDILLKNTFFTERKTVTALWNKTDSANRKDLFKVNLLQDKVDIKYTDVLDETDQIDAKIGRFVVHAFAGEFDYVWVTDTSYNHFNSALKATINLNNTQLYYFFKSETPTHFAGLALLLIVFCWIMYNRAKTKRNNDDPEPIFDKAGYIYKLPFVSSLLIATAIAPYFYDHPPVIFLEGLFIVSMICMLILVKKFTHKTLFNSLHLLFWLAIIYSVSNILIEVTNADRYAILGLSVAAIIIGMLFLQKVKTCPENYFKYTKQALQVFIGMQFLSLICNITGRFSLSKILGVTAVYNLWFLVSLFFVVEIIMQGLFLQFETKKEENNLVSWIDFNMLQKKFRSVLNTLATLLWLFFLLQNLNVEDFAIDYVTDILGQSRSVAGASFTFGGFVDFILVIWLSSVISRIVSYFFDISAQRTNSISALKKKNRTSTLLIRLGVFSIGFLLAVAASNFPLDKLTFIISAFGIGIGFGLQNIVNNLVSGVILAFEKPIQIGDIVEVDNKSGTMKEIGIRSSRLLTSDGSEVIIPNADLISHQIVNWTLTNNNRRIELIISTAYGTDIDKAKNLLKGLLKNRDDIMADPGPSVFLHNLSEKSVDFRVFFWAADISHTLELKSGVLTDIYTLFNKEGIEIAFQQNDMHLILPDGKTLAINNDSDKPAIK